MAKNDNGKMISVEGETKRIEDLAKWSAQLSADKPGDTVRSDLARAAELLRDGQAKLVQEAGYEAGSKRAQVLARLAELERLYKGLTGQSGIPGAPHAPVSTGSQLGKAAILLVGGYLLLELTKGAAKTRRSGGGGARLLTA